MHQKSEHKKRKKKRKTFLFLFMKKTNLELTLHMGLCQKIIKATSGNKNTGLWFFS